VLSSRGYSVVLPIRDMDRAFQSRDANTRNMAVKSMTDAGRCDHLAGEM
jgi:hypothetical protein